VVEDKLKLVAILDQAGVKRSGNIWLNELRPALVDEFELCGTCMTLQFTGNMERALDAGRARGMIFTRRMAAEQQGAWRGGQKRKSGIGLNSDLTRRPIP
jgi:hypothetical protein